MRITAKIESEALVDREQLASGALRYLNRDYVVEITRLKDRLIIRTSLGQAVVVPEAGNDLDRLIEQFVGSAQSNFVAVI